MGVLDIFFSTDQPGFCITSCFFSHLSLPNSAFRAVHLHLSETAEKLEEAQADITRRVVIIARKETVKYAFRRALRNPDRTNVSEMFARPSPGSAVLTCRVFPSRGCVFGAGGFPRPAPAACLGCRGRGSGGAARLSRGGHSRDPRPRLQENHINTETKAGPAGGGPAGGGGTKYGSGREGEKFRGRGIIIIMEVKM